MSSLGGCLKSMVAARLGYAPLPTDKVKTKAGVVLEELYSEGKRLEDVVIDRLRNEWDYEISRQQEELDLPMMDEIIAQGHIDGVGNGKVLEIKSMRPASFALMESKGWETPGLVQKYKWQISGYMLGTGLEGELVVVNSDPGLDDETRPIRFYPIEKPFYTRADILNRVLMAEAWVRAGELPITCDFPNFPCPFYYLHEDDNEVEEIEDEGLIEMAKAVVKAQRDKKEVDARLKVVKEVLEKGLGKRKGEMDIGGVSVVRYQQRGPGRWDEAKMKEDGIDVAKYKVEGKKGWRMKVEERNGE